MNFDNDTTYFINFSPASGISIDRYRAPGACINEDVRGLVADMRDNRAGTCELDGSLAALEDGSLWGDDDQTILELLHASIREPLHP